MVMVIPYKVAKASEKVAKNKYNEAHIVQTRFLGARGNPNLPLIQLNAYGPGRLATPHFHDVDQFQIMVAGRGKIGRRDIGVNSVHFSRAYTPYGPFVSDAQVGLTCLIIRVRPDAGAVHSRQAITDLAKMPDRHPWQITHDVIFPETDASSVMLKPIPEIQDDNGLATYTLRMKPGTATFTPDPATGNGLFVLVTKGGLIHEQKQSEALTLVYLSNRDEKFEICAGPEGLEALIVQFPRAYSQVQPTESSQRDSGSEWHCSLCSFVYDERAGLPEEGIAPGTRWQDIPETWTCPDCATGKSDFQRSGS